jgi:DnaJ-class molecular chaperone
MKERTEMAAGAQHSHYKTLGVAPDAEPEAVRRAYRRQAQRSHPDKSPGDARAVERMARINEAYAVLSHPQRRASYDQWMAARHARTRAEQALQAARPSRFAASWPWGLVFATATFAVSAFGTVLYKTTVPQVASMPPAPTTAAVPAAKDSASARF